MRVLVLAIIAVVLIGCNEASQPPQTVEVTRVIEVTREVPKPVEITRSVAVTVEITKPIEVTRQVEVTRVVEVTRLVEVTPRSVATSSSRPATVPTKASVATWTPEQVMATFKAAGLEAENSKMMSKEDYGLAPLVGQGSAFPDPFAM